MKQISDDHLTYHSIFGLLILKVSLFINQMQSLRRQILSSRSVQGKIKLCNFDKEQIYHTLYLTEIQPLSLGLLNSARYRIKVFNGENEKKKKFNSSGPLRMQL